MAGKEKKAQMLTALHLNDQGFRKSRGRFEITGTVLVIISFATIKLPNYSDEK